MKKALALVLASVMALSLTTVASAYVINPGATDPGATDYELDTDYFYGDDTVEFFLEPGEAYATGAPLNDGTPTFANTGDYTLSVSGGVDNSLVKISTKLIKNAEKNGVAIKVLVNPADENFTVKSSEYKAKIKVVQKDKTKTVAVSAEIELKGDIANHTHSYNDGSYYSDASGKYILDVDTDGHYRVIDADIFEDVNGNSLAINFGDYSINFSKVAKQNTSLYLYAKTDVVSVDNTRAIASIKFAPTRVKDAAIITMPISADNENYYGESVYVYAVVNGKPAGEAMEGTLINHNAVMFKVSGNTTLGTFAAYGAKTEGDAEKPAASTEKPAIPETGTSDIVNIAIVFAVFTLAAAGFAAVKKLVNN